MLPEALLRYSVRDGRIVPHYLTERDHPWLRGLIDEHDRFVGHPRRELDERMRESLPCDGPLVTGVSGLPAPGLEIVDGCAGDGHARMV